jgi:hypothetical protein
MYPTIVVENKVNMAKQGWIMPMQMPHSKCGKFKMVKYGEISRKSMEIHGDNNQLGGSSHES